VEWESVEASVWELVVELDSAEASVWELVVVGLVSVWVAARLLLESASAAVEWQWAPAWLWV
jgi:hypothetical protein